MPEEAPPDGEADYGPGSPKEGGAERGAIVSVKP